MQVEGEGEGEEGGPSVPVPALGVVVDWVRLLLDARIEVEHLSAARADASGDAAAQVPLDVDAGERGTPRGSHQPTYPPPAPERVCTILLVHVQSWSAAIMHVVQLGSVRSCSLFVFVGFVVVVLRSLGRQRSA